MKDSDQGAQIAAKETMAYRVVERVQQTASSHPVSVAKDIKKLGLSYGRTAIKDSSLETVWFYHFPDGSGFLSEMDGNTLVLWPLEWRQAIDEAEILLPVPGMIDIVSCDNDPDGNGSPILDEAAYRKRLELIAASHPNPPEALTSMSGAEQSCELHWDQPDSVDRAIALLRDIALIEFGRDLVLTIHSGRQGSMSRQEMARERQQAESYVEMGIMHQLREAAVITYSERPHATVSTCDGVGYRECEQRSSALTILSADILERLGNPVGWHRDYNDGAYTRQSGYTSYSESVEIEVTGTAHEIIGAHVRVRAELNDLGLWDRYSQLVDAQKAFLSQPAASEA